MVLSDINALMRTCVDLGERRLPLHLLITFFMLAVQNGEDAILEG